MKCSRCTAEAIEGRARCQTCRIRCNTWSSQWREKRREQRAAIRKSTVITINVAKPLSTGQVARLCCVAPRTVAKWIDTGLLPGYRLPGSEDRRVKAKNLARFMNNRGMDVPRELLPQADVSFGLLDAISGFQHLDAFRLGALAATTLIRAALVGDTEGLDAAVSVGRALREANSDVRIVLVLDGANAAFVSPGGVFDRVVILPCDLAAVALELTAENGR